MRNKTLGMIALIAALYVAFGEGINLPDIKIPSIGGGTVDTSIDPLPEPSPAFKSAVQPLVGIVPEARDRADLSGLYRGIASVIEDDKQIITTTSQVRSLNQKAGTLLLQVANKPLDKMSPGIGLKLNDAAVNMLGLENKMLDQSTRTECVKAFQAIAWAFEQ